MYSTSELDELFQILNLIEKDLNLKGLEPHWSNITIYGFSFRVFAIDTSDGSVLAVITINNATNCDWEDIAVGIGPGGLWHIYVGDIGGNAGKSRAISELNFYTTHTCNHKIAPLISSKTSDNYCNLYFQVYNAIQST